MPKVLVLDDDTRRLNDFSWRFREIGWEYKMTETAQAAIDALKTDTFDVVFLDHDLGGEQMCDTSGKNTGSEVARYIADNPTSAVVIIHSYNPYGAEYMRNMIPGSHKIPGIWSETVFKKYFKQ